MDERLDLQNQYFYQMTHFLTAFDPKDKVRPPVTSETLMGGSRLRVEKESEIYHS